MITFKVFLLNSSKKKRYRRYEFDKKNGPATIRKGANILKIAVIILRNIGRHFVNQDCPRMAMALSYQTLLALVPLGVLALSLFTYVDAFYKFQEDILFFLFDNLLPATISQAHELLQGIVGNAKQLTYVGIGGLAVTAILLFSSIEASFGRIWQIKTTRNFFIRLFVYIVLILLGPIALASSMTLFTWIADLTQASSGVELTSLTEYFKFIIPFGVVFIAMFSLYRLIPAGKVNSLHAAIGAGTAASLFILGKHLFRLYLIYFPSYEIIYGALAILPLFLIWLYVSWLLVLLGATITAVLGFHLDGKLWLRPDVIDINELPKANG
jgi:membrane protein